MRAVLVANRGEIAVRVLATVRALGLRGIAVYSDADAEAPHVRAADDAWRLGPAPAKDSYLDFEAVLGAARASGADALHPGYGFLSEDPAFARACADAGVTFVGPPAEAMATMGDKIAAKQAAEKAGVPVVPGVHRSDLDDDALAEAAGEVGYPALVKAAGGGGGRGMRVVADPSELRAALAAARREAVAAFGQGGLLLERLLSRPRHVEVQVLADAHGEVAAVGERECSLQRRHQKIVEECPSPWVDEHLRAEMCDAAVAVARACGYVGAGTVEFLVDPAAGAYYFLEMNTRLQVEHPVTEEVYGIDLVAWQLRIADGQPLAPGLRPFGHAVEARVYAEDPARDFVPTGGTVSVVEWPADAVLGPGRAAAVLERAAEGAASGRVRVDSGIEEGMEVGTHYDPLLAKVVAHGRDRDTALRALRAALGETAILGVGTNVGFLRALLAAPDVLAGRLDTGLVERCAPALAERSPDDHVLAAVALERMRRLEPAGPVTARFDVPDGWRPGGPAWTRWRVRAGDRDEQVAVRGRASDALVAVGDGEPRRADARVDGRVLRVAVEGRARRYLVHGDWIGLEGWAWQTRIGDELAAARTTDRHLAGGPVVAPMPGTVITVEVRRGERVTMGQTLLVVEAMKMEQPVVAPADGLVAELAVAAGDRVRMEQVLVVLTPELEGGSA